MQIKSNPWLRTLYLTLLLPLAAGVMAMLLARHAIVDPQGWGDRVVELIIAIAAGCLAVKCWGVTFEFARDMRRFLETMQAIKRREFVLPSSPRAGLPEIEELAREMGSMDESPDTSLAKWIVLSRDHQAIFVRLVEAMSTSMKTKSFYARGHSGRVAEYSTLIAAELGLPPGQGTRIRFSALLHDIGKIGMDPRILTKPDVLTAAEFEVLKTHPARGVEMLRPVLEFSDLLTGIELHHESLDGTGYPHGLQGEQIPLMARIIAVADTFDAMTHNRTYQNAMDGPYALRLIRTMAGRKFDPQVVDAFCRVFAAGHVILPERSEAKDEEPGEDMLRSSEITRAPRMAVDSSAAASPPWIGASSN